MMNLWFLMIHISDCASPDLYECWCLCAQYKRHITHEEREKVDRTEKEKIHEDACTFEITCCIVLLVHPISYFLVSVKLPINI